MVKRRRDGDRRETAAVSARRPPRPGSYPDEQERRRGATPPWRGNDPFANWALGLAVLGLASVLFISPPAGLGLGILAVVLGIIARKRARTSGAKGMRFATAAVVLGALDVVAFLILLFVGTVIAPGS